MVDSCHIPEFFLHPRNAQFFGGFQLQEDEGFPIRASFGMNVFIVHGLFFGGRDYTPEI